MNETMNVNRLIANIKNSRSVSDAFPLDEKIGSIPAVNPRKAAI
jgi:hypothetical protein